MNVPRTNRLVGLLAASLLMSTSSGCITFTRHAVPASRLPQQFVAPAKSTLNPINFAMLQGTFPDQYILEYGDVLAVAVQGVIPPDPKELPPIVAGQATLAREYYPPKGVIDTPSYGLPIPVQIDGTIQVPLIEPISVAGLTLPAAAQKIRKAYIDSEIVRDDVVQINLSLLRNRVNRVLVLREDASQESANFIRRTDAILHKRGSAAVVDLPAYESDVLHALATTGGLPGIDAYNEVWVLRKSTMSADEASAMQKRVDGGELPSDIINDFAAHVQAIRLPLKLCPDEPVPFTADDVVLQDGDVVYIEPRRDEYFYTGGLLGGGQIPLPRDEDLDILEAIALAQGSVGGLGGTSSVAVLRAGAGIGNIIPPTRALILRKLPNGQQLPIRVDLSLATREPSERVRIMAGDYVMMYYKPSEIFTNSALNFFNISYAIPNN